MATIVKTSDRIAEAAVDGEIVIMRIDNGDFFALSGTAAAAWQLIDGKRDRAALVAALAVEFTADEDEIAKDVDSFLLQLKEIGLLVAH